MTHTSMPMVATLYHHDNGTAPPFIMPTPHEARHYFVEPMALDCSGNIAQARDVTILGAATTTVDQGFTSVA